jgi:6-phosphogluconolactonase (cycloisomerase 2 family)
LSAPKGLVAYNGVLYVANQNNNSVVAYKIGANGSLTLLNSVSGVTYPQGITMAP